MKLEELLTNQKYDVLQGATSLNIENISYDSRKANKNSLFVCIDGGSFDGHHFIDNAIKKGAIAIIVEKELFINNKEIAIIKVENSRVALSTVSKAFYGDPSSSLNMVGITGTNGKTSISFLISEILQHNHSKVGVIGTIGLQVNNESLPIEKTTPTTPDSLELQMILNEMKMQKATDVVMEVTSIALDQHRVDDCKFDIGVFTNLTPDHLDFHGTMENYKKSKRKLFDLCKTGIINIDDPVGKEYSLTANCSVITYSIENDADLKAKNIKLTPVGTYFEIDFKGETYEVNINLPGKFNVYNVLAAIGASLEIGVSMETILKALLTIEGARGRFESLSLPSGYTAVVDYAHTPDALDNVLKTAKEFQPNRLITVFGCGGDRDKTKRALMGKISGELSDITFITSDNPRTENPKQILSDIEEGIKETDGVYEVIEDRKLAIEKSLKVAMTGDIVIVAGKGHETYQILKEETIHFDDREIILQYIYR